MDLLDDGRAQSLIECLNDSLAHVTKLLHPRRAGNPYEEDLIPHEVGLSVARHVLTHYTVPDIPDFMLLQFSIQRHILQGLFQYRSDPLWYSRGLSAHSTRP